MGHRIDFEAAVQRISGFRFIKKGSVTGGYIFVVLLKFHPQGAYPDIVKVFFTAHCQ